MQTEGEKIYANATLSPQPPKEGFFVPTPLFSSIQQHFKADRPLSSSYKVRRVEAYSDIIYQLKSSWISGSLIELRLSRWTSNLNVQSQIPVTPFSNSVLHLKKYQLCIQLVRKSYWLCFQTVFKIRLLLITSIANTCANHHLSSWLFQILLIAFMFPLPPSM